MKTAMCRDLCPVGNFSCNVTGRCIPLTWVCDGEHDCGDNDFSDENRNCAFHNCYDDEFMCKNKRCIPYENSCDGFDDCGDGSDEKSCGPPCKSFEYNCKADGFCILKTRVCDGYLDCSDGADESGCFLNPTNHKIQNVSSFFNKLLLIER